MLIFVSISSVSFKNLVAYVMLPIVNFVILFLV